MDAPSCAHHAPCGCQHSHPGALLAGSWQHHILMPMLPCSCCVVSVHAPACHVASSWWDPCAAVSMLP